MNEQIKQLCPLLKAPCERDGCAMWRKSEVVDRVHQSHTIAPPLVTWKPGPGYCGLAGKPLGVR